MRSVIIVFENGNIELLDTIRAQIDRETEELEAYFNDPYDDEETAIVYRSYDIVNEEVEKVFFDGIQVWPQEARA